MTDKNTGQGAPTKAAKTESRFDAVLNDMESTFEQLCDIKNRLVDVNNAVFGSQIRDEKKSDEPPAASYLDRRSQKNDNVNEVLGLIRTEITQLEEL